MVIWYFLSRTRGKRCFLKGGSTKLAARMTVFKTVVFNPFTFSFRVVCFSILSDCFGLWDGLSLSSHHTLHFLTSLLFFFFFFGHDCAFSCVKSQPRCPKFGAHKKKSVDKLSRGNSTKTELCGVQEKLFSRKVRHVVKSFPFFFSSSCLFLFSPCCHSGFLSAVCAGGEAWRERERESLSQERKSTINGCMTRLCFVFCRCVI